MAPPNAPNGDRYNQQFVRWGSRPGNSMAARFAAGEAIRQLQEINALFDRHQVDGVIREAEALTAAEARRQAAHAAGWKAGEPGE